MIKTVVDDAKAAGLDGLKALSAGKNAAKCAGKLGKAVTKVKALPEVIKVQFGNVVALAKELKELLTGADAMG